MRQILNAKASRYHPARRMLGLGDGCVAEGPRAVRGEEVAGLDDQAMSTGLDKRDLDKMLHENMKALQASSDHPALAG